MARISKNHLNLSTATWRHKNKSKAIRFGRLRSKSLEDTIESLARKGVIANAAIQAIKKQHENGLSVTIKIDKAIYLLHPNGKKEIIRQSTAKPINIQEDILQIPD